MSLLLLGMTTFISGIVVSQRETEKLLDQLCPNYNCTVQELNRLDTESDKALFTYLTPFIVVAGCFFCTFFTSLLIKPDSASFLHAGRPGVRLGATGYGAINEDEEVGPTPDLRG